MSQTVKIDEAAQAAIAEIVDAVRKYTTVLSAARQSASPAALDRVRLSAYMLTNALRDWEAAR